MFTNLKFYYQNVRGLRTKTVDIYNNVVCNNFDVIVLTETWLNGSVLDRELFDNRYEVYRRDRESSGFHSSRDGGGVLIAVSRRYKSSRLFGYESDCEDLWVRMEVADKNKKKEQLYICSVYIPPPVQKHMLDHFIHN